jgi:hypothetical protein
MAFVPFTVAGQWRFLTSLPLSYLLVLPKADLIYTAYFGLTSKRADAAFERI